MKEVKQIVDEIKSGNIKPIYLLMGEEGYYIDRLTEFIEENILTEDERSFNHTVLYGPDTNVDSLVLECKRFPMMAERQVVVVREAQHLKTIEGLAGYADNPTPTTVLVLAYKFKSADKRKAFYKNILKNGVVFESKTLYDSAMPDFIVRTAKSKGLAIDDRAVRFVFECLGNDLSRIAKEFEKLQIVLPKGSTITVQDIEVNIGFNKDYTVNELIRALSVRDSAKAYKIGRYFVQSKEHSMFSVLPLIIMYFSKLLHYHGLKDKSKKSAVSELKIPMFAFNEYVDGAKNYPMKRVSGILSSLREIDLKGKGVDASLDFDDLMKELLIRILG